MDFAQAFQLKLLSLHRCSNMLHHRKNERRTFLVIRCEIWVVFHIVTNECNCESVFVCVSACRCGGWLTQRQFASHCCGTLRRNVKKYGICAPAQQPISTGGKLFVWHRLLCALSIQRDKIVTCCDTESRFYDKFFSTFCSILFVVGVIAIVSLFNLLWLLHRI